ncbi:ABC transporter permease [Alcaligenaceae bacterium A4P071]|nr:ABC transporter permease [Alcaligenaceae bacterium B3P038]MDQ2148644.1 ABC transporter permease [Alcaligenaceae bacterium C4P045]MDQ2185970.1 ABC transporter permease [Alcaligenaceae bacterium A4P071]
MFSFISGGVQDLVASTSRMPLVGALGWQDVRQRYRRSALGPFWLTLSMGVMIASIGIVFGQIFNSPIHEFFPYLSVGLILWMFMLNTISEGCAGFISSDAIIKQLPIPLPVHVYRLVWRNIIILAHNLIIFPLVLIIVQKPIGWIALMSIPGFVLLLINMLWVALLLSTICARYRDIPQIVASVMQVVFYLTPIMWLPSMIPNKSGALIVGLNPFYHLIEIVRAPLMGANATQLNWMVTIGIAVVGWLLTLSVYGRYRRRIAYWL